MRRRVFDFMLVQLNRHKFWSLVPFLAFVGALLTAVSTGNAAPAPDFVRSPAPIGDHTPVQPGGSAAHDHDHDDCCDGVFCHLMGLGKTTTGRWNPGGKRIRNAGVHPVFSQFMTPPHPPPNSR